MARRMVTAGAVLISFAVGLEMTVTSAAAPTMARELHGFTLFSWIFAAYTAAMTVTVPLWGKLADLYGRRLCILISVSLFGAGCIGAGLSQSMFELIGWRVVQGAAGGAFTPLAAILLADTWPLEKRPKVQGLIVAVGGAASVLGPALGGLIVHWLSWRWVFFITLPGLAIALILLLTALPKNWERKPGHPDYMGAVLFALLLGSGLVVLHQGQDMAWFRTLSWWIPVAAGLLWLSLAVLFWKAERRAAHPLLPLTLFRVRFFSTSVLAFFLASIMLYGALTYLPLFGQEVRGLAPAQSAHLLTPLMVAWVGLSGVAAWLALRVGFRLTTLLAAVCGMAGYGILMISSATTPFWITATGSGLIGLTGAFCLTPLIMGTQASIPKEEVGSGTATLLLARNVGASGGVTFMGLVMGLAGGHAAGITAVFTVGLGAATFLLLTSLAVPRRPEQVNRAEDPASPRCPE